MGIKKVSNPFKAVLVIVITIIILLTYATSNIYLDKNFSIALTGIIGILLISIVVILGSQRSMSNTEERLTFFFFIILTLVSIMCGIIHLYIVQGAYFKVTNCTFIKGNLTIYKHYRDFFILNINNTKEIKIEYVPIFCKYDFISGVDCVRYAFVKFEKALICRNEIGKNIILDIKNIKEIVMYLPEKTKYIPIVIPIKVSTR